VLIIIAASVSLAACAAGPSPAAQSTPAQVPPTAAPAETTSAPPTAAPAETTSAPPTAAPAETTSAPSQSPEAPPTAAASPAAGAGRLAWPARLPDGHQLRPEQSSADADQLQLMLADPANAQDFITIGSVPDSGEGFGMQCKDTVQVRGQSGVVCTTGGGATVQWVEQGWRYSIGGGLMSGERAVAIAETLEFVDLATARQRLGQ
jgi:hypothetical protein